MKIIFGILVMMASSYLGYSGHPVLCYFGYIVGVYFIFSR